jgi:hypothetical protein
MAASGHGEKCSREAVTRPSMRLVGVRTLENQAVLMHNKARELLVGPT